jgi:hypothetical protein
MGEADDPRTHDAEIDVDRLVPAGRRHVVDANRCGGRLMLPSGDGSAALAGAA